MKAIAFISTAALSLLLGIAVPALAQHESQSDKQDHPQEQKNAHEQGKPEKQHAQQPRQTQQKQNQAKQPQHAQHQQKSDQKQAQPQQARHQQDRNNQPQHAQAQPRQNQNRQTAHSGEQHGNAHGQRTQEQERVQRSAWQQHRSGNWQSDHRNWQQRGGYHGYRIPDDRFRGYFGPEHGFRIYGLPFMVEAGYPRFQYNGYWFSMVDPWPQSWANNWYDTDEVYVAYVDNGYYLFNRRYPTVGIAINISN
jgi:hypothetical protein